MGENQQGNNFPEMIIKPVGVIKSEVKKPTLVADSGNLERQSQEKGPGREKRISELVIDINFAASLDGVEGFSHLLVLYWAHLVPPEGRKLTKVHPMGKKDLPLTGIFATCSPARPNPILLTAVRLLERTDNVLRVEGLDAVDGSPIVDIKPYNPSFSAVKDIKVADWMEKIHQEMQKNKK